MTALVIRADASTGIGMGHAMRCLALAQALADAGGGAVTFVMADPPDAFVARAGRDGVRVAALAADPASLGDAEETLAHGAGWVVVDGYHLDGRYQRALADAGARVLVVDDHAHLPRYHAHVLLNQNAGAGEDLYRDRAPGARLLLGPGHALLRREFRVWEAAPAETPPVARRILVTLGGGDADDVSSRVLRALALLDEPHEVQVLVGAANPHREELDRAASAGPHPVELIVDADDVPRRMAWADLAVAGAGSTSWELARIGTPQLAIVLAENQRAIARGLEQEGAAVALGWHADLRPEGIIAAVRDLARDPGRRRELSRRGRELVDGQGAPRVLAALG
jgi:UDP-2,4-diacetamido-2,4,6-trideoxy-beta-L-altropyranose hydrolase